MKNLRNILYSVCTYLKKKQHGTAILITYTVRHILVLHIIFVIKNYIFKTGYLYSTHTHRLNIRINFLTDQNKPIKYIFILIGLMFPSPLVDE